MLPATVPLPGRIESRAAWPSTDPSAGAWCDGVRGRVTGSLTLDPSAWLISIEAKRQKAVDAPGERSGGSHDARVVHADVLEQLIEFHVLLRVGRKQVVIMHPGDCKHRLPVAFCVI